MATLVELGGRLPRAVADETAWRQPLEMFRQLRGLFAKRSP